MSRSRLSALVLVAGFGMVSGCLNIREHSFFRRHHEEAVPVMDACEMGSLPEGAIAMPDNCGPMIPAPPTGTIIPPGQLITPEQTQPQLSAPPRLAPVPAPPSGGFGGGSRTKATQVSDASNKKQN